jgi:hypothetical protein
MKIEVAMKNAQKVVMSSQKMPGPHDIDPMGASLPSTIAVEGSLLSLRRKIKSSNCLKRAGPDSEGQCCLKNAGQCQATTHPDA